MSNRLQLDRDSTGTRYYRNAVERHWDPAEIPLDEDREISPDRTHTTI
jgi:ribonucleoside-diphosphate reductase beta chain